MATMWLLNTSTLRLEHFPGESKKPKYAILSHRWGKDEDEVSFQDVNNGNHQQNYKKLFALSGLLVAFPVADKSKQVHSTTNLETVKTHDSPHLIYDFPISLRH